MRTTWARAMQAGLLLSALSPAPWSPSTANAMRLAVEEYATLCRAERTTLRPRVCTAAAGTAVRLLGTPVTIGETEPDRLRLVRIIEGPCAGFELTLAVELLADLRQTAHATPRRPAGACPAPPQREKAKAAANP